jgi:hypothetical protein
VSGAGESVMSLRDPKQEKNFLNMKLQLSGVGFVIFGQLPSCRQTLQLVGNAPERRSANSSRKDVIRNGVPEPFFLASV